MKMRRFIVALLCAMFSVVSLAYAQEQEIVIIGGKKYIIHNVVRGETLYSLSRHYGVTINEMRAINRQLVNGLIAGQRLKIPYRKPVTTPQPPTQPATTPAETTAPPTTQPAAPSVESSATQPTQPVAKVNTPTEQPAATSTEPVTQSVEQKVEPTATPVATQEEVATKSEATTPTEVVEKQSKVEQTELTKKQDDKVKESSKRDSARARREADEAKADSLALGKRATEESAGTLADALAAEVTTMQPDSTAAPKSDVVERVAFRKLQANEVAEVALMLPLGSREKPAERYVDFYRGFLLGLDSVRMSGYSVNLKLFNTARSDARVSEIIAAGELDSLDLVVGPIYEAQLDQVVTALNGKNIPIVSPLSRVDNIKSNALFQMSPTEATKMSKVGNLFDGSHRIVVISSNSPDKEFEAEVNDMLRGVPNVGRYKYVYEHPANRTRNESHLYTSNDMIQFVRGSEPIVIIVTAGYEVDVDRVLAAISAANRYLTVRGQMVAPYVVLGNNHWINYPNLDRATFFSNNVNIITSYYAHRSIYKVKRFDKRFIAEFGTQPTRYAYRGYDAAMIFVRSLYEGIDRGLEGVNFKPLITPYMFETNPNSGVRENGQWVRIRYDKDFSITAE